MSVTHPTTIEDLFAAIATPHVITKKNTRGKTVVDAIHPFPQWTTPPKKPTEKELAAAWEVGSNRLDYFINHHPNVKWVPLDDNPNNESAVASNACAGRALAERFTNGMDANIELKVYQDKSGDPVPASPAEAVKRYFGVTPEAMRDKACDDHLLEVSKNLLVRSWDVGIYDIRDHGIGILPDNMAKTILSLHKGNKAQKPYLIGKHGYGASATFNYSKLTVIATRHVDSDEVGFTVVKKVWEKNPDGSTKTLPVFLYMTVDGKIPRMKAPKGFTHGTFIRHIGYDNSYAKEWNGRKSTYALGNRMLGECVMPFRTEACFQSGGKKNSDKKYAAYHPTPHTVKGAFVQLDRSRLAPDEGITVVYSHGYEYTLDPHRFGPNPDDMVDKMGTIKIKVWVIGRDQRDRKNELKDTERAAVKDAVKNYMHQELPIHFNLDGQNHAEGPRAWLTNQTEGAGLYAVGGWMMVQVICDDLHPMARHELFTSTRDRMKATPVQKEIFNAIVHCLKQDTILAKWDSEYNRPPRTKEDKGFEKEMTDQLMKAGILSDNLVEVATHRMIPRGPEKLDKIKASDVPTFIRWAIHNEMTKDPFNARVRLYPGQSYTWFFETDATPRYWDISGMRPKSKIVVSTNGLVVKSREEMQNQRVKCRILCPEDAVVGEYREVFLTLYSDDGDIISTATLTVEVEAQRERTPCPKGKKINGGRTVETTVTTVLSGMRPDAPEAVRLNDENWSMMDWGQDTESEGYFLVTDRTRNKFWVRYNSDIKAFADTLNEMRNKGLHEVFQKIFDQEITFCAACDMARGQIEEEYIDDAEASKTLKQQVHKKYAATLQYVVRAARGLALKHRDIEKAKADVPVSV